MDFYVINNSMDEYILEVSGISSENAKRYYLLKNAENEPILSKISSIGSLIEEIDSQDRKNILNKITDIDKLKYLLLILDKIISNVNINLLSGISENSSELKLLDYTLLRDEISKKRIKVWKS